MRAELGGEAVGALGARSPVLGRAQVRQRPPSAPPRRGGVPRGFEKLLSHFGGLGSQGAGLGCVLSSQKSRALAERRGDSDGRTAVGHLPRPPQGLRRADGPEGSPPHF